MDPNELYCEDYCSDEDEAAWFKGLLEARGNRVVVYRHADLQTDDHSWGWVVGWIEKLEEGDSDVW